VGVSQSDTLADAEHRAQHLERVIAAAQDPTVLGRPAGGATPGPLLWAIAEYRDALRGGGRSAAAGTPAP
jgi:hypothetical protein